MSGEGKHTMGPWIGFIDGGGPAGILPAMRHGVVCEFSDDGHPTEADFALMIAGPEMLEALKGLRLTMRFAALKFDFSLDGSASMDAADAAIAKATGGQS